MECAGPSLTEGDLEAELLYSFRRGGAREPAYESIVACGDHACTMHYVRNDAPLVDGELVLIDAGCEYGGYAADITRTFPVSGRFSAAQREILDLVLAAQQAAIEAIREQARTEAAERADEWGLDEALADDADENLGGDSDDDLDGAPPTAGDRESGG
jgi:Xaa-Pro aminopeptidase